MPDGDTPTDGGHWSFRQVASMVAQVGVLSSAVETLRDTIELRFNKIDTMGSDLDRRLSEIERAKAYDQGQSDALKLVTSNQRQRTGWLVPTMVSLGSVVGLKLIDILTGSG